MAVIALLLSVIAITVSLAAPSGRSGGSADFRLARLERRVEGVAERVGLPPETAPSAAANVLGATAPANVLARVRPAEPAPTASGQPASTVSAGVVELVAQGKKINAIKLYRQETGVGLKEAKEAVEEVERGMVRP
jgi:ribosomal protein L7/L12